MIATSKSLTAKPSQKATTQRAAGFRDKISTVINRISDSWRAAAANSDVPLEELRKAVAEYDRVLSDLQDQERLVAEDTTIHVNTKRKRSVSPSSEHKRHCDRAQPDTCSKSTNCHESIETVEKAHAGDSEKPKMAGISREAIEPKAGELYLVHRKQSQLWLAALVLPLADLHTVGVSASIQSLGLSRDIPSCVVYDLDSEQFEWRNGYANGEAFAHERKFPVAYFAGSEFPDGNAVEWVTTEDLRTFDRSSIQSLVPYCDVVNDFLERRTKQRAPQTLTPSLPLRKHNEICNASNDASFERQKTPPPPKISTTAHLNVKQVNGPQPVPTQNNRSLERPQPPKPSSRVISSSRGWSSALGIQRPAPGARYSETTNELPENTGVKENPKDVTLPRLPSLFKSENGAHFGLRK
ncbi:hypothetical protein H9Q69_014046 [Fusarium xylarioides]|nr:hypothetical protein H9Q69_014046 [Fusarium xylarioides]